MDDLAVALHAGCADARNRNTNAILDGLGIQSVKTRPRVSFTKLAWLLEEFRFGTLGEQSEWVGSRGWQVTFRRCFGKGFVSTKQNSTKINAS